MQAQDKIDPQSKGRNNEQRRRPLSSKQERKLMDYLDENFLELTRNFKKRSESTSSLKTLTAYLEAARKLLGIILQIPPLDPSAGLRIAYLLRLTGEVLGSIPGYSIGNSQSVPSVQETLQELADFLDDLDQSWLAVLQGQVWDPEMAEGVDLVLPIDDISRTPLPLKSTPPSQTEIARLRSLLFAGESSLEEWLTNQNAQPGENTADKDDLGDVTRMLERMGLLEEFDSLFARTLDYLGDFSGKVSQSIVNPDEEALME
ncbi:hypothetical protein D9613_003415 [Agrocybe pediades]|uniref:Uncharacterized protein n=1 Tax=Agrocybe pediades TaxID=84607 RepID=A0A8H4QR08_9AGAR|nr:hypothetical protein D9613_003415 [Agrocybe pediades]